MAILYWVFSLLSVGCLILLIIGLMNPPTVRMPSRKRAFLVFFGAMVLTSILAAITMPEEEKAKREAQSRAMDEQREKQEIEDQKQEALEKTQAFNDQMKQLNFTPTDGMTEAQLQPILDALDDRKIDIEKSDIANYQFLNIYLKPTKSAWSEKDILFMSADTAGRILHKLRTNNVQDLKQVRVMVSTPLVDQYNNERIDNILMLNYDYAEILKLNMTNTPLYQDYLKFAEIDINHKVGRDVYVAWCADDDNAKWSGRFCAQ
ncbi:MAG: hypothetical protein VX875_09745 [Pseudomonadota bacterium]|nr:hypothetical protein [Pseudomonadota bacterium]